MNLIQSAIPHRMRLVIGQSANMKTGMEDPEFRLMVSACKAAYQGSQLAADDAGSIDWTRFLSLSARHRVDGLCWHGLGGARDRIPPWVADELSNRSGEIVATNLRAAAECARLKSMLDREGMAHLFLKGIAVGALAYPQPFLKMSWDIDLLLDADQLGPASRLLRTAGYVPIEPFEADGTALQRWHEARKESVWHCECGDFTLDLHMRTADNPRMVPGLGVKSPSQTVRVAPGIELATFAKDELFAYLCVHGASSAWFRLKWLADISALLHRETPEEIARLYHRSQNIGAGRAADQALLLAEKYFGIILPADLRLRLHSNWAARWLAQVATKQLASSIEPTMRFLGTASIHYSQPFLQPSLRFKFSEIARQLKLMLGSA